jgi:cytochrome c oxidase assembly factor CtaG
VALVHRRLIGASDRPVPWPRVRVLRFVGALAVALVALGWPLGDLAAHWSLCALVLQRCVLVLAVASLLLSGLPDDVLAWVTRPAPVDALLLRVLRPPAAVVTVTVLLVGSMAPPLVAAQSQSAVAWALLAVGVTLAGVVLWLPILGRVPGIPRPRPMIRAVYLVAQAVVPVFLSFVFILATRPLYQTLDHSGPVIGLSPLADQQIAGFVSKLSFLLTLLTTAAVELVRAPDSDDDLGPEDPLVWADIERHFERADRKGLATSGSTPEAPGTDGEPTAG